MWKVMSIENDFYIVMDTDTGLESILAFRHQNEFVVMSQSYQEGFAKHLRKYDRRKLCLK